MTSLDLASILGNGKISCGAIPSKPIPGFDAVGLFSPWLVFGVSRGVGGQFIMINIIFNYCSSNLNCFNPDIF